MSWSRQRTLFALTFFALALTAPLMAADESTNAKDSLAPKHAGSRWLPCEKWVMYHWNPIDVPKLLRTTGLREGEIHHWLRYEQRDHHTLAGLLSRRGFDPEQVVFDSLALGPGADGGTRRILRERARRVLTQGHLAQHIFFHRFHHAALRESSWEIFRMSQRDYIRARQIGFTPTELGRLKLGLTRDQTGRRIMRVIRRYELRGVAHGATNREQADFYLKRDNELLNIWMQQRYSRGRPSGRRLPNTGRGSVSSNRYVCNPARGFDSDGSKSHMHM